MNNRAIVAACFVLSFAACGSNDPSSSTLPNGSSPTLTVRVLKGRAPVAGRIVYHAPAVQVSGAAFATTDSSGTVVFSVALGQQVCVWTADPAAINGQISNCLTPVSAQTTVALLVP